MKFLLSLVLLAFVSLPAHADSADTWNIRFSPLGALLGMVDIRLDYKVTDNLALGPGLIFWNVEIEDVDLRARGLSLNAEYNFNRTYEDGWILDFSLGHLSIDAEENTFFGKSTANISAFNATLLGGYHWHWDIFNIALGAGFSYNNIGKIEVKNANGVITDSEDYPEVHPAFEFNLGWTF